MTLAGNKESNSNDPIIQFKAYGRCKGKCGQKLAFVLEFPNMKDKESPQLILLPYNRIILED
jgi:hypothetical protein